MTQENIDKIEKLEKSINSPATPENIKETMRKALELLKSGNQNDEKEIDSVIMSLISYKLNPNNYNESEYNKLYAKLLSFGQEKVNKHIEDFIKKNQNDVSLFEGQNKIEAQEFINRLFELKAESRYDFGNKKTPIKTYSTIKSCLLEDGDDSDDYIYEGKLIHNVEVLPKDTWEIVEFYKYGAVLKHIPTSVLADSKPNKNVSLEELKSLFASDKIEIDGIEKGNTKLFNICIKAIIKCIDSIDMAAYKENLLAELNASKSELEKTIEASNILASEKSNLEKETSEKIQSLESDIAAKSISIEEANRLKEEETTKLKKQLEDLEALNAMRTLIDMLSDDIAKKDKPSDLPENKSGKIKVKEIRLFSAEGKVSGYGFPKVVKTYEEANDAVMPVYQDAIESSYANKCGFTVTFEDGSEYSADLLVSEKHDNPTKGNVIGKHIKDYLEHDLKNDNVSDETKKQAKYFLENYDLGFDDKNILIKDWYIKNYPSDDLGEEINNDKTFNDIWNAIHNDVDVYSVLGVSDSIVRERVFEKLAEINGVEYGYVYNKWLNPEKYSNGGGVDEIIGSLHDEDFGLDRVGDYFIIPEISREKVKEGFKYNVENREGLVLHRAKTKQEAIDWADSRYYENGGGISNERFIFGIEYKESPTSRVFKKSSLTMVGRDTKEMNDAIKENANLLKKQEGWHDFKITKTPIMENGGSINEKITSKAQHEIDFLKKKGYDIDVYSTLNRDAVFGGEKTDEFIIATQGSIGKGKDVKFAIAYWYKDEEDGEMQISRALLDEISDLFKGSPVILYTNAGVDLHSITEGKHKNIQVVKVPYGEFSGNSDEYSKGGTVESLEKELRKLQRDLNSHRLSTYTEGDESEEQKALNKEREVKLARFHEVLGLLREKDTKYSKGGGINSGRDLLFKSNEPHEQKYNRKREFKKYGTNGNWFNDFFENGGDIVNDNALMVINDNKQIKHHAEELNQVVDFNTKVPAWVVSKVHRSASDLSDATHYLDGENNKMQDGGEVENKDYAYMMLGRLKMDNDAYLDGVRTENRLWAGNIHDQIEEMKKLWNGLPSPEKPEWLSMEDILDYEVKMKEKYKSSHDFDGIMQEYKELTSINNHDEAAILLAENFGTVEELNKLKTIQKANEKRGYSIDSDRKEMDAIANKYYYYLKKITDVPTVSMSRVKSDFVKEPQIFQGNVVSIGENKFKIEDGILYIKKLNSDWSKFRRINY